MCHVFEFRAEFKRTFSIEASLISQCAGLPWHKRNGNFLSRFYSLWFHAAVSSRARPNERLKDKMLLYTRINSFQGHTGWFAGVSPTTKQLPVSNANHFQHRTHISISTVVSLIQHIILAVIFMQFMQFEYSPILSFSSFSFHFQVATMSDNCRSQIVC